MDALCCEIVLFTVNKLNDIECDVEFKLESSMYVSHVCYWTENCSCLCTVAEFLNR